MLLDKLEIIDDIGDNYKRSSVITAVEEEIRFGLKSFMYLDDTLIEDVQDDSDYLFRCGCALIRVDTGNLTIYYNVSEKALNAISKDDTDEVDYDLTVKDLEKKMSAKGIRLKGRSELEQEFHRVCKKLDLELHTKEYDTIVSLLAFTIGTGKFTNLLLVSGYYPGEYSTYDGVGYIYNPDSDTVFVLNKELPIGNTGLELDDVNSMYEGIELGSLADVMIQGKLTENKLCVFRCAD